MSTDSVKLNYNFVRRLAPAVAYTVPIVGLLVYTTQTVYIWLLMAFLAILAVNYWMRVFWPDTILEISKKGIWYQEYGEKWIKWEDIHFFCTRIYKDSEGSNPTLLLLKTTHRFMDVQIDLTELRTNDTEIREWINAYAGGQSPVDKGHESIESSSII